MNCQSQLKPQRAIDTMPIIFYMTFWWLTCCFALWEQQRMQLSQSFCGTYFINATHRPNSQVFMCIFLQINNRNCYETTTNNNKKPISGKCLITLADFQFSVCSIHLPEFDATLNLPTNTPKYTVNAWTNMEQFIMESAQRLSCTCVYIICRVKWLYRNSTVKQLLWWIRNLFQLKYRPCLEKALVESFVKPFY